MKTPFDALLSFAPEATAEDTAEAAMLGVDVATYRAVKLEVMAERAKQATDGGPPSDIAAEQAIAMRLRSQPGLIKPRNTSPNILVQAWKTPGEVAQMILFVICYLVGLVALVVLGGERVTKMEGIFQCVLLGVLIIPAMWVSGRIWEAIGERARDGLRLMVRYWPLTLFAGFFVLVLLKLLGRQFLH